MVIRVFRVGMGNLFEWVRTVLTAVVFISNTQHLYSTIEINIERQRYELS